MTALVRAVAQVQLHRRIGIAARRRRLPRQVYPKLVELEYAKAIATVVDHARASFEPLLHELPALLARANEERTRADIGESRRARELVDLARLRMTTALNVSQLEALARVFADRTQRQNREQLGRQIKAALGVDIIGNDRRVAALIDHFVHENVALIRAIPESIATGVDKVVTRAFTTGTLHGDLAEQINERFAIGERHARMIARDQVGKLNGQVNAARQQDLGVTSFVWRTAGDERVRPEHEALDGETFDYADPPDEGLPGEPALCRCYAEPIFAGILAAAADDDSE